jgi:hypothetical protein
VPTSCSPASVSGMSVRWRERLGGMTYAWSVECPRNDQDLVRPLVTAAGETVFMCDSGGEVWLRPSALSPRPSPRHPTGACHPTIPGTTRWAVTEAARLWPERSWWPAVGRRRCDASGSPCNFRRLPNGVGGRFLPRGSTSCSCRYHQHYLAKNLVRVPLPRQHRRALR